MPREGHTSPTAADSTQKTVSKCAPQVGTSACALFAYQLFSLFCPAGLFPLPGFSVPRSGSGLQQLGEAGGSFFFRRNGCEELALHLAAAGCTAGSSIGFSSLLRRSERSE